jgi:hypothetical protein
MAQIKKIQESKYKYLEKKYEAVEEMSVVDLKKIKKDYIKQVAINHELSYGVTHRACTNLLKYGYIQRNIESIEKLEIIPDKPEKIKIPNLERRVRPGNVNPNKTRIRLPKNNYEKRDYLHLCKEVLFDKILGESTNNDIVDKYNVSKWRIHSLISELIVSGKIYCGQKLDPMVILDYTEYHKVKLNMTILYIKHPELLSDQTREYRMRHNRILTILRYYLSNEDEEDEEVEHKLNRDVEGNTQAELLKDKPSKNENL